MSDTVTSRTEARQASLSSTVSCLLKFMSIELVMLSNHLILCCPLLLLPSIFPSIRIFSHQVGSSLSGGRRFGASAAASVFPTNIQGWFPLGLTCLDLRRRQWHPTPVLLPGKSHGQRSLVGYSPWDHKESDTTECIYMMEYRAALKRRGQVYRLSDKYVQEIF